MKFYRLACRSVHPENRPVSFRVMRRIFLVAALGAGLFAARGAVAAPAGDTVRIIHAFSGWRDAASFKRISEYFTGRENTGGEIVLRTHPDQRGGYYFLVRTANSGPPVAVRIRLSVVTPDHADPKNYSLDATLPAGDAVFDLGLTGPDWPGPRIHAVAWKLDIDDESGRMLAGTKSYLWDKPAGE